MLKSERIRQRIYQRGLTEGREAERQKQENDNNAWYERMQNALKRGEDFNEPPPWQKR